jgi:hypothetical protein
MILRPTSLLPREAKLVSYVNVYRLCARKVEIYAIVIREVF